MKRMALVLAVLAVACGGAGSSSPSVDALPDAALPDSGSTEFDYGAQNCKECSLLIDIDGSCHVISCCDCTTDGTSAMVRFHWNVKNPQATRIIGTNRDFTFVPALASEPTAPKWSYRLTWTHPGGAAQTTSNVIGTGWFLNER